MKKYIILSVNDNQDYLYHVPLSCWAWRKFGWEPFVFMVGNYLNPPSHETHLLTMTVYGALYKSGCKIPIVNYVKEIAGWPDFGYRSETIAQVARLYAACEISLAPSVEEINNEHWEQPYIMTGDIDMIPLSDYWQPANGKPTVWGHDLTGYTQFPICYIGMNFDNWLAVMKPEDRHTTTANIKFALDNYPQAKDPDFYKYWFTDQQLITDRLKPFNPTIINRGQYPNGFARGRIDRGAWTLDHKEYIDCHLHHQIHHKQNDWKYQQTLEMLHKVWPEEDFAWYESYHNEFKLLTGHA